MEKTVFSKRDFLCPVKEEVDSWVKGIVTENYRKDYISLNAELTIADCTRVAVLYFSIYTSYGVGKAKRVKEAKREIKAIRKKMAKFMALINAFATALEASLDKAEEHLDNQ